MSAAQAIASEQFLLNMGPMVEDEKKVAAVMRFIVSLRDSQSFIDPDFKQKPMYSSEEYWNKFAKGLGRYYGLNDIREAYKNQFFV